MGVISSTIRAAPRRADVRLANDRLAVWLIGFVVIVYLALSGGGYDPIARSEVGVVVWWVVLIGAVAGVLPRARLSAWAGAALFFLSAFLVWTWVGVSWSGSEELTLLDAGRVSTYLGMFVLGLGVVRRGRARTMLNGVASAIGLVAALAVLYRIAPSLFPADTGARFFYVGRLQWPFEYSDAVGEFVALGLPLLLVVFISGRTLVGRAAGAAAFVLAVISLAMTQSRGGILAAAVGLVVVALLAVRLTGLSITRRRQVKTALIALILLVIVSLLATGVVHDLWDQFRRPQMGGGISGSHRYQYWRAALNAFSANPLQGIGPGGFQFYWAQHNSLHEFVLNAHSLYLETLAETGIVGFVLIVGLLVTVLLVGSRRALQSEGPPRLTTAAATASFAAFCAAAGFDWVWQIGAVPVAALLLAAVVLNTGADAVRRTRMTRAILALAAVPALYAVIVPLASTASLRNSEASARNGDYGAALQAASSSQRLEPSAASPSLQRALVFEQLGQPTAATGAISSAETNEPLNWRIWLVASRIATEAGRPGRALADYERARYLNPTSPLCTKTAYLVPINGTPLRELLVPPGKAGANQYFETIPGVAGNLAPPQPGRTPAPFAPSKLRGAGALARLGPEGKAAAELAVATAYTIPQKERPAGSQNGDSPIATIASVLAGDDAGGLGLILPVLLVLPVLIGAAVKYRQTR